MATEEQDILSAYQNTETNGLEFGRLCYDYRETHGAQGSRTGQGLAQILRKLDIKEGKAYYWIAEYEISIGKRPEPADATADLYPERCLPCPPPTIKNPNYNKAGTRGYDLDKPNLNLFLRRLTAVAAFGASPFPDVAAAALFECDRRKSASAVVQHIEAAITRLEEYKNKFKEKYDTLAMEV